MDLKKDLAASASGAPRGIGPSEHQERPAVMSVNNFGLLLQPEIQRTTIAKNTKNCWQKHLVVVCTPAHLHGSLAASPDERQEHWRRSHNGGREPLAWRAPLKTAVVSFQRRALQKSSRVAVKSPRSGHHTCSQDGQSLEARMEGENFEAEVKTGEEDPLPGVHPPKQQLMHSKKRLPRNSRVVVKSPRSGHHTCSQARANPSKPGWKVRNRC